MKAFRIAIAASLLMTSGTALAQTAKDAGCLLVSNVFSKDTKNADAAKLAQASVYFFLGRIGPQTTAAQLKAMMEQQSKTLTDANAGGVMNECIKDFQSKMQLVESLSPAAAPPAKKPQQPQGR
jgi:hypothetical protein